MSKPKPAAFVAVNNSPAMSGHFATLYDYSWMEGGVNIHGQPFDGEWFPEPYDSAPGRHETWQAANREGEAWAKELGVDFIPATAEKVALAKVNDEQLRKRQARIRELMASGMLAKDAFPQAKAEFPRIETLLPEG